MNFYETMQTKTSKWCDHPLAAFLLIVVVACVCYGPAIHSPFLYDDLPNITRNPHIAITDLSYDSLAGAAGSALANRPMANLSFAINHYLHGYNVTGYHLINILIHIMSGFFVFLLTRQTLDLCRIERSVMPLSVAIVWLVVPLHIQSVTYIVQRMNAMATMFYLLALISYIHARQLQLSDQPENKKIILLYYSGCGVAGLLGLTTKEIVATLPVFIFLYEWFFFQDLSIVWIKNKVKWMIGILLAATGIALVYLDADPLGHILGEYSHYDFTLSQRLFTQSMVVVYYLSLMAFPHPARLNLIYDFPLSHGVMNPPLTLLCLLALTAITAAAIYSAKRNRLVSFAIIWFAGNLLIESSVIGLHLVFEHRTYLPSIFPVMVAIVLFLQNIDSKRTAIILLCGAIIFNGIWTLQRNGTWQDRISFWQDQALKTPRLGLPFNQLGLAFAGDRKGYHQAITMMNRALEINRVRYGEKSIKTAASFYNLGEIYRINKDYDQALPAYDKALHISQQNPETGRDSMAAIYNNLGTIHKHRKNYEQAIDYYRLALKIQQQDTAAVKPMAIAGIWNNLGLAFAAAGNPQQAIECFEKALRIIREDLGRTHPLAGHIEKSLCDMKQVVTIAE